MNNITQFERNKFFVARQNAIQCNKWERYDTKQRCNQENLIKLKKVLDINDFTAELILIDPKEKNSPEKEKQIEEFCEKLI